MRRPRPCSTCAGPTRRELLAGGGAFAALSALSRRGAAEVQVELDALAVPRGSAKAVIFVNLNGAPSHLDTFDAKDAPWNPPDADLQPLGNGVVLSRKFFPELSRAANDLLLVRSVASWEAAHERGQFYLQTGHSPNPAFVAETPNLGSVVSLEADAAAGKLPAFVAPIAGGAGSIQGATFLGGRHEPMAAPTNGSFETIRHDYFGNQSQRRFEERFALLQAFEAGTRATPADPLLARHLAFHDAARPLMYDGAVEAVFRLTDDERARYGGNDFGNACLVARNAVRADIGVRFVHVVQFGWDTHQSMFDKTWPGNHYNLTAVLDRGVGMLVDDLRASGHLASTLVIVMGEFSRTPGPLNPRGGRDHHRDAMAIAMLGGGVKGGRVIGATDAQGARIVQPGWSRNRPVYFEDLTATIYSALGINWTKRILDTPTGRIFEYVPGALQGAFTAVEEVFG